MHDDIQMYTNEEVASAVIVRIPDAWELGPSRITLTDHTWRVVVGEGDEAEDLLLPSGAPDDLGVLLARAGEAARDVGAIVEAVRVNPATRTIFVQDWWDGAASLEVPAPADTGNELEEPGA